jgi:hypothetical protein
MEGVPSSGAHRPEKSDIRAWGAYLESFITAIGASGSSIYVTRAELFSDLSKPARHGAWVIQDPTVAYNGIYRKNGGVGTGSWTRVADLPYSFIVASDSGLGTPDAIQATTPIPVSSSALVILNIFDTNTGSPVTVSFNGGSPLTIKTNSGNNVAVGGLRSDMRLLGVVAGSTFRLVSDQVSSAVVADAEAAQAAAEAAQSEAEAARDLAAAYAAGVNLPPVLAGDEGKILVVKPDHSGFELTGRWTFAETMDWFYKAALLDPASYAYFVGRFDVTVPAGETWLVVNAWQCKIGSTTAKWFHRNLKAAEAVELTAGTRISASSADAFLWVCRPYLVDQDTRYLAPKDLFYSRLQSLRSIATLPIAMSISAGSPNATIAKQSFPTDFEDGVLRQVSTHDAAWVILGAPNEAGAANTLNEISDSHQMRLTGKMLLPFERRRFPKAWLSSASVSGDGVQTSLEGHGVILYQKLPTSWRSSPKRESRNSVLSDSPIIYYPFSEPQGSTADCLGSSNTDAAIVPPVYMGNAGATSDNDTAFFFSDDDDGRVEIPSGSPLNFGSGDFTIEAWVNLATLPNLASANPYIINGWATASGVSPQSFLVAVFSQKLRLYWRNSGGTTFTVDSGIALADRKFYHFIAGKAGSNIFIRVVGQEARKTAAVTGSMASLGSSKVIIGQGWDTSVWGYRLDGSVDELAFYSSALLDSRADAHHAYVLGW